MNRKPAIYSVQNNEILKVDSRVISQNSFLFNVITDYNKLPKKYNIIINLYPHVSDRRFFNKNLHLPHNELVLPLSVLNDMARGDVQVIFSSGWESALPIKKYNQQMPLVEFSRFSELFNCPLENILYLIPNFVQKSVFPVRHIVHNHSMLSIGSTQWNSEYYRQNFETKILHILRKRVLKYKGLIYARTPRLERLLVLSDIEKYGIRQNFNFSLIHDIIDKNKIVEMAKLWYNRDIADYVNGLDTPIYSTDGSVDTLNDQKYIDIVDWGHSLTSSFQVVVESYPDTLGFLTEKIFKPFTMLQPFIAFGSAHSISTLRSMNFRVFDKIIDHSYDCIEDNMERYDIFLKEMVRLTNISKNEWSILLNDNIDTILHNVNNMKTLTMMNGVTESDILLHNMCCAHNFS